ncbi:hypothetical protein RB653_003048 [Dictyostelium firmibasis]|uniref:SET domain-containing protein n=1 Tax=Dictyostelium firmibasis TaxID=79012 RepID=A0AAN7TZA3_9MYCE
MIPNNIKNREDLNLTDLYKEKYEFNKKGIELRNCDGEKGIGIFSNRKFKKGEKIMKIEPYVWSVAKHGIVCDECLKNKLDLGEGKTLKRCSGCKLVYYCSTDCQTKSWKIHKRECKILSTVPSTTNKKNINTKSTTMLLRLFIKRNLELDNNNNNSNNNNNNNNNNNDITGQYEIIDSLLNHKTIRSDNNEYKSFSSGFCSLLGEDPQLKAPIVLDYLLKLEPNCITIPRCEASSIGLYPLMLFFNHSCKPNISIINNRKELLIITNKDIEKDEELFINYSPAICYRNERIDNLKQCFFFDCKCTLCLNEEKIKSKDLYITCTKCNGGRINQEVDNNNEEILKCYQCLKIFKDVEEKNEIIKKKSIINNLYKKLSITDKINFNDEFKSFLELYCKEFHPTDPLFYEIVNRTELFYLGNNLISEQEFSMYHKRYQIMIKYHLLDVQNLEYEYCRQMIDYVNTLATTHYYKDALGILTDLMSKYLSHIDFYGFNRDELFSLRYNLQYEYNNNLRNCKIIK